MEGQRVEFVIAHHGQGGARLDHRPHDVERLTDLRAAVDEVAEEHGLAGGMTVDAGAADVAEPAQQRS